MPKPGLTGKGKDEGFDLGCFERTNDHLTSWEEGRDDFVRLLEARDMTTPSNGGDSGGGYAPGAGPARRHACGRTNLLL